MPLENKSFICSNNFKTGFILQGEGNSNPLQYSCLETPVDRGAWLAAVHGVSQSQTRLKRFSMHACIGEGNGNPLQCSCLENPRDRGAWWAAIYRVTQGQTRLKQLSSSSNILQELQTYTKYIRILTMRRNLMENIQFNIYHSISQTYSNCYIFGYIS